MKLKIIIGLIISLLSPTVLIASNEIWIDAKPLSEITEISFDCNTLDLNILKVFLVTKISPKETNFYSAIYFEDIYGETFFIAMRDILNNYSFILYEKGDLIKSQSFGLGFISNTWENISFYNLFKKCSCIELKQLHFLYGISSKVDLSDFEGAIFKFK